jgi:hypothetical protein
MGTQRAYDWASQWSAADTGTKAVVAAVAKKLGASELIADRSYHLKSYPQCFVRSKLIVDLNLAHI